MLIWGWSIIDLVWNRYNALILVIRNMPYLGKISIQFISQMQKPLLKVLIYKQQRVVLSSKNSSWATGEFDISLTSNLFAWSTFQQQSLRWLNEIHSTIYWHSLKIYDRNDGFILWGKIWLKLLPWHKTKQNSSMFSKCCRHLDLEQIWVMMTLYNFIILYHFCFPFFLLPFHIVFICHSMPCSFCETTTKVSGTGYHACLFIFIFFCTVPFQ